MPFGAKTATQIDPFEEASWFPSKSLTYDMPLNPPVKSSDGTLEITSSIANTQYQILVKSAFDLWSAVSGLSFTDTTGRNALANQSTDSTGRIATHDIRIGFADLSGIFGTAFGETLGRSDGPQSPTTGSPTLGVFTGPVISAVQIPNAGESLTQLRNGDWQYSSTSMVNKVLNMIPEVGTTGAPITLFQTIVHEVGHDLGLDHNFDDPYSVMDDGTHGSMNLSVDLNDVAAIQKLYGAPITPPEPLTLGLLSNNLIDYGNVTNTSATYSTQVSVGTIKPFSGFNIKDINGLGFDIKVTVRGGGSISDGVYGSFSNGIFDETTIDPYPYPVTGPDPAETLDNYVGRILRDLVYKPSQTDKPESDSLTLQITDSIGRTLSETITVNTIKNGQPDTFNFNNIRQLIPLPATTRIQTDSSFTNFSTPTLPTPTPAPTPTPTPGFAASDTSTGQPLSATPQPYTGPVAGIQEQFVTTTPDNLNIGVSTPNWFIHGGSGNDAIAVSSGTNVLDGGLGSNFLTGGSGTDTFVVDDRSPTSDIWSTVNNFHVGDAATVFGITPTSANIAFADGQGAAGYTGLTLHATTPGQPNASLTLVGYSSADLNNGRLSVSYGAETDGTAYIYIHGNS